MKVRVDANACQGHALCALMSPEVFHTDDDTGHAVVPDEVVAPELEPGVIEARDSCPERAVQIF